MVFLIALLLLLMAFTKPSSKDYKMFLQNVQGLKCNPADSSNCFHSENDLLASHLTHLFFYMTAESYIFGDVDNKICVIGIFNHFFVIENNLHPDSDKN
ncbi:hypothetical protein GCM10010911_20600 [Paenibacillus nasutitermitis]|uniref:Uncharacterized protein n=1 Tax=Paenibacillus nasutitermitis TaxID=1652958 RepID=A0A916YVF0_9BACL|nr:hypothetical protein GCM10010911_20600 [Paenibacillus nasutitermitis]